MPAFPEDLRLELRALLGADNLVESGDTLETLSKDYYWYSPALRPQLDHKRADVVAKPGTIDELRALIAACFAARVAVTPRQLWRIFCSFGRSRHAHPGSAAGSPDPTPCRPRRPPQGL
jgi:hypothetical protein